MHADDRLVLRALGGDDDFRHARKLVAVSELTDAPAITRAWRREAKPMMGMPISKVPKRPLSCERLA